MEKVWETLVHALSKKQRHTSEGKPLATTVFFCLVDCWLEVGGPCDRQSQRWPSWGSSVFKQMLKWFTNFKLLLHASHAALPI
jgi:hypothetical protein